MLVHVSQPHTDGFKLEGNLPEKLLNYIYLEFGQENISIDKNDNDYINVEDMNWYKERKSKKTPGSELNFYRNLCNMTQSELAQQIGTTKYVISLMEHNKRPISMRMAKRFAEIFQTSVYNFLSV